MASDTRPFEDWFHWAWAAHSAAIVVGFIVPVWGMLPLCLFGAPGWMVLVHVAIWALLTLSPLLGLLAVWKVRLRRAYLALAIATPIYAMAINGLVRAGITLCEGP